MLHDKRRQFSIKVIAKKLEQHFDFSNQSRSQLLNSAKQVRQRAASFQTADHKTQLRENRPYETADYFEHRNKANYKSHDDLNKAEFEHRQQFPSLPNPKIFRHVDAKSRSTTSLFQTTDVRKPQKLLKFEDISPELAAQIVRHYLLPMFERKTQTKNQGSLYHDLKLADYLESQLQTLRAKLLSQSEALEEAQNQSQVLVKENKRFKQLVQSLKAKLRVQECTLQTEKWSHSLQLQSLKWDPILRQEVQALLELQQAQLSVSKLRLGQAMHSTITMSQEYEFMKHKNCLTSVQREVVDLQTAKLFDTVKQFPTTKQLIDTHDYQLSTTLKSYQQLREEHAQLAEDHAKLLADKKWVEQMNRELVKAKEDLTCEKAVMLRQFTQTVRLIEHEMRQAREDCQGMIEKLTKTEQQLKVYQIEYNRVKERNKKLRSRRFLSNGPILQTCLRCGRDYNETENYNWSCRMHQSQYSGEMWWCCGKTNKDANGCKFSKHQPRLDKDDEDWKNPLATQVHRCKCCREIGHSIENCLKDPNMRTTIGNPHMALDEFDRVETMRERKRLHSDTMVQTTHLLKKCVITDKNSSSDEKKGGPFQRGAMTFEDYNYSMYNPYILVQKEIQITDKRQEYLDAYRLNQVQKSYEQAEIVDRGAYLKKAKSPQEKNSSKASSQQPNESQQQSEEDNLDSNVFFTKPEIRQIRERQSQDTFANLIQTRDAAKNDQTKIDIENFQPSKADSPTKRKTPLLKKTEMTLLRGLDLGKTLEEHKADERKKQEAYIELKRKAECMQIQNEIEDLIDLRIVEQQLATSSDNSDSN